MFVQGKRDRSVDSYDDDDDDEVFEPRGRPTAS